MLDKHSLTMPTLTLMCISSHSHAMFWSLCSDGINRSAMTIEETLSNQHMKYLSFSLLAGKRSNMTVYGTNGKNTIQTGGCHDLTFDGNSSDAIPPGSGNDRISRGIKNTH